MEKAHLFFSPYSGRRTGRGSNRNTGKKDIYFKIFKRGFGATSK
jgi:hypothetical protein